MNQILHIFRKDTRRFWSEILASIVIAFAFVYFWPNQWRILEPQQSIRMSMFAGIFAILMPLSWWMVTARVVHAETLVGDRQFWITRPYEWPKLLAAKALFLAVWLGGPYLLAQCWLLAQAGYNPLEHLAGLIVRLLLVALVFVLPVMALAAATSNFARLAMTVLGSLIVFVVYLYILMAGGGYVPSHPYDDALLYPLLFAGCATAIGLAYAMRRVWLTRGLLLALPILLAISVWAYRRPSLVDRAYPQPAAGASAPVNVSFTPNPTWPVAARSYQGEDYIDMGVGFSGVAENEAVILDDFKFTLTAADGSQWTSPWEDIHQNIENILPGHHSGWLHLMISPAIYDRFKSGPVTLRIAFAASRYAAEPTATMGFPVKDAALPGIGFCTPQLTRAPNLYCRAALHEPRLTYMTAQSSKATCSYAAQPGCIRTDEAWVEPTGSYLSLAAVWTRNIWFRSREEDRDNTIPAPWHLCPGSPLTVTQFHLQDRTQTETTLTNFVLPAYVQPT